MPTVRVLRPFANEHHDRIVQPGDLIEVTENRACGLGEGGLVEPAPAAKAALLPDNKMAPAPANKTRVGRPPKARA